MHHWLEKSKKFIRSLRSIFYAFFISFLHSQLQHSNYEPGDKIFLFGFSRGAYTARMVASFIGEVGILTRKGMKRFGKTFAEYQLNSFLSEKDGIKAQQNIKHRLTNDGDLFPDSTATNGFSIECVGVFDTVGSVGLPVEVRGPVTPRNILGFSDKRLGAHISRAYQALALDEKRKDFVPVLFEQTDDGLNKKQVLVQCWFRGAHSDIGGGYIDHDLSDLSLIWMASNIQDIISLDIDYLKGILEPTKPWGKGVVHNSLTGVYQFADSIASRIYNPPTQLFQHEFTHEVIHPSVLEQPLPDDVKAVYANHPEVICKLHPLEETMRTTINVADKHPHVTDPAETVKPLKLAAEEFVAMLGKFVSNRDTLWGKSDKVV